MGTYIINHKYRDSEIIIPYVGIKNNLKFIIDKDDRYVITADNKRCLVTKCEYVNVFDIEQKLKELYGLNITDFLHKWRSVNKALNSLEMVVLKLKKLD